MTSNNPPGVPASSVPSATPASNPWANYNSATYQEYYANYMKYMQFYASNMYPTYPASYTVPPPSLYKPTTAAPPPPPPPAEPPKTEPEPPKPVETDSAPKKSRFDITTPPAQPTPNIVKHQNLYAQYQQKQQIMLQQQQLKQQKQAKAVATAAAIAHQKTAPQKPKNESESDVVFDINKWPVSLKNYCAKVYQQYAASTQVTEQQVTNYLQNRITQAFKVKADLGINWDAEKMPDVNTIKQLASVKIEASPAKVEEKKVTNTTPNLKRKSKSPARSESSASSMEMEKNASAKKKFKKEESKVVMSRVNFKRTIANDVAKRTSDGEESDQDVDEDDERSDEEFKPFAKRNERKGPKMKMNK